MGKFEFSRSELEDFVNTYHVNSCSVDYTNSFLYNPRSFMCTEERYGGMVARYPNEVPKVSFEIPFQDFAQLLSDLQKTPSPAHLDYDGVLESYEKRLLPISDPA